MTTESRDEKAPNLTERDKTRFLERGFTVVENAGHSLRLIKRDDARQAISIKWEDLSALRELITLALDDGPMVIGLDMSGQSAKNAATRMRDACVAILKRWCKCGPRIRCSFCNVRKEVESLDQVEKKQ